MAKDSFYGVQKLVSFVKSGTGIGQKSSEVGRVFEQLTHAALSQGGQFRIRKPQSSETQSIKIDPREQLFFSNLAEVKDQKNAYLIPVSQTYVFDSIMPPDVAVQVTVNLDHGIARKNCMKFLKDLDVSSEKLRIYIATTPDKFLLFKKCMPWKGQRKYKDQPPANQFVLEVDLDRIKGFQTTVREPTADDDEDSKDEKEDSKDENEDDVDNGDVDDGHRDEDDELNMLDVPCCECSKQSQCKTKKCECNAHDRDCSNSCPSSACSNVYRKKQE